LLQASLVLQRGRSKSSLNFWFRSAIRRYFNSVIAELFCGRFAFEGTAIVPVGLYAPFLSV